MCCFLLTKNDHWMAVEDTVCINKLNKFWQCQGTHTPITITTKYNILLKINY